MKLALILQAAKRRLDFGRHFIIADLKVFATDVWADVGQQV